MGGISAAATTYVLLWLNPTTAQDWIWIGMMALLLAGSAATAVRVAVAMILYNTNRNGD